MIKNSSETWNYYNYHVKQPAIIEFPVEPVFVKPSVSIKNSNHAGVYEAAVKAMEALDECIGKVVEAIKEVDGQMLITADHGNAEMMINPETGGVHTAHTNLPVPLIYVGSKEIEFKEGGKLSDLAPTMLALTDTAIPAEMSGEILFK